VHLGLGVVAPAVRSNCEIYIYNIVSNTCLFCQFLAIATFSLVFASGGTSASGASEDYEQNKSDEVTPLMKNSESEA